MNVMRRACSVLSPLWSPCVIEARSRPRLIVAVVLAALTCLAPNAGAQGIPEPGLIMYGVVRNTNNGANIRWSFGSLAWTIRPVGGGAPITVSATLTNINDQFCYLVQIPCENTLGGFTVSSNTLPLGTAPAAFNRAQVVLNGTNQARLVIPALTNFTASALDRGRLERVDLDVSVPLTDLDGNGLPDDWERFYFGHTGVDPNADPDHDGMSNFAEYIGGTDPNDPNSLFRILRVARNPAGGETIEWSSTPDRYYAVQRSGSVLSGYRDLVVGIAATAPLNAYWDSSATNFGSYFYRLRLDRVFIGGADLDGNGLPDDWERLYFGHVGVDPGADPDHDGMTNLQEYLAGTNPLDPNSFLKVVPAGTSDPGTNGVSSAVPRMQWASVFGRRYSVVRSSDPRAGFLVLESGVQATPPLNSYTDTSATGLGPYFYRLRIDQ